MSVQFPSLTPRYATIATIPRKVSARIGAIIMVTHFNATFVPVDNAAENVCGNAALVKSGSTPDCNGGL